MKTRLPVTFVEDPELIAQCDRVEKIKNRSSMVSNLIRSYGLKDLLRVIPSREATRDELLSFHSGDYLQKLSEMDEAKDEEKVESIEDIGIGYDCPFIPDILNFVKRIGGGSMTAAEALVKRESTIAVNWFGGWHHAQRDSASGFCYVNDIVLAIHVLRKAFDKVLYVDLDVHHGDGVENAFAFTPKVYTFSLHQYEPGFFPGTGKLEDCGQGKGKNFSTNVPLKSGMDDEQYSYIFSNLFDEICYAFRPDAIVVQCGGDVLSGDPLGGFNVTLLGMGACTKKILSYSKPTLFLGGGGYNLSNTAIYWAYLTALFLETILPSDIPDCDPFFSSYGPSFELKIDSSLRKNENSSQEIEDILERLFGRVKNKS